MARKGNSGKPGRVGLPDAVVETKVFRSGNSDAVRIPRRFDLSGRVVRLRRLGTGAILIEPKRKRRWPVGFLESFGRMTPDFAVERTPPVSQAEESRATARFRDEG